MPLSDYMRAGSPEDTVRIPKSRLSGSQREVLKSVCVENGWFKSSVSLEMGTFHTEASPPIATRAT